VLSLVISYEPPPVPRAGDAAAVEATGAPAGGVTTAATLRLVGRLDPHEGTMVAAPASGRASRAVERGRAVGGAASASQGQRRHVLALRRRKAPDHSVRSGNEGRRAGRAEVVPSLAMRLDTVFHRHFSIDQRTFREASASDDDEAFRGT
jgi:hypothetical protein